MEIYQIVAFAVLVLAVAISVWIIMSGTTNKWVQLFALGLFLWSWLTGYEPLAGLMFCWGIFGIVVVIGIINLLRK